MVNQNQIEHARTLVQTSASLSAEERQEWLSLLPFMSDKQLLELCTVLESSQPVTPTAPEKKRIPVTGGRKALPQPPDELDLPAPHTPAAQPASGRPATVSQKQSASSSGQNTVSAYINRNFAQALHRAPGPVADIVPPVSPQRPAVAPQPKPTAVEPVRAPLGEPPARTVPVPVPAAVPEVAVTEALPVQPVWEEVVPRLKSLEDVRRLTVATLRAKGTEFLEEGLKGLGVRYGYFSVQLALEQSPLYQTYLSVGAKVLQDHAQFESLQNELSSSGRPYLAKTEFEEMSDLLQRIKGG